MPTALQLVAEPSHTTLKVPSYNAQPPETRVCDDVRACARVSNQSCTILLHPAVFVLTLQLFVTVYLLS